MRRWRRRAASLASRCRAARGQLGQLEEARRQLPARPLLAPGQQRGVVAPPQARRQGAASRTLTACAQSPAHPSRIDFHQSRLRWLLVEMLHDHPHGTWPAQAAAAARGTPPLPNAAQLCRLPSTGVWPRLPIAEDRRLGARCAFVTSPPGLSQAWPSRFCACKPRQPFANIPLLPTHHNTRGQHLSRSPRSPRHCVAANHGPAGQARLSFRLHDGEH